MAGNVEINDEEMANIANKLDAYLNGGLPAEERLGFAIFIAVPNSENTSLLNYISNVDRGPVIVGLKSWIAAMEKGLN